MNPAAKVASRNKWVWRAWMSLGTPIVVGLFLIGALVDIAIHVHGQWKWDWKDQFKEWFGYFGEKHRKSLHSLGLKPERGGTLVKAEPKQEGFFDIRKEYLANISKANADAHDDVWLFEDKGYGREFTNVQFDINRVPEDVQ